DHFPFAFQITFERGARHPLGGDSALRLRPDTLRFATLDGIGRKVRPHVAGTYRHDMDVGIEQLDPRRFSDGIHGKLRRAVGSMIRKWDVSGNTGDVD